MDGDLWDWSYDQGFSFSEADEGSSYGVESGWQADFYFGKGKDVIEENAINEKCCVHVLKILIQKAVDEIDVLEEDLVFLQCDLAWTDSRNQFEACCKVLREKIDVLHNSIKCLRERDKISTDDRLPLQLQPVEKLYQIVMPFLGEIQQDDGQEQHATVNSQSIDTSMQLVGPFCETSSIAGMKVRSEVMEDESILVAVDTIPTGSVLKHRENDSIRDKEIKPEIAVDGVCSNVLVTEENDCLKPDNLKSVSVVKIEESKEQRINNPCKSRELVSASNVVGDRCFLKEQKDGKSVSEKANPEVPRQSDGFSGNKRRFDSISSSTAHSNSGNCNTEEKLIDFLIRKKNKSDAGPIILESNGRNASSCLPSFTNGRVDSDLQVSETKKSGIFDTSYFRIMLLRKLQDQQGNDMVRTQTKETEKLLLEDSQNLENVSHEKSHLNMGHMRKAFTENGQSNTSISKAKKQQKQGAIGDDACLDLPLERNLRVKSVEPCQLKAEVQVGALDAEKNLGPLSQTKGTSKMLVDQEFIDLSFVDNISSSDQIKLDSGDEEDKQMAKSCPTTDDDDIAEIFSLLTSPDNKQKDLTLVKLRIMAKHFNFTKYHKLRKQALLDKLVCHLERGGRQTNDEVMRHH